MIKLVDNIEQLQIILEIEKELFSDHAYSYNQLLEMFENKNYQIYVYEDKDQIVGYLIILMLDKEAEIIKIGVSKNSQNLGLGSKFMAFMKDTYEVIFLEVSAINTRAISFYEFHNFKLISRRKNYYQDNSDALIYQYQKGTN